MSPVEVEELTFVSTGELDLYFIVPPDHPFADRDEVAFADSAGELWISFSPRTPRAGGSTTTAGRRGSAR